MIEESSSCDVPHEPSIMWWYGWVECRICMHRQVSVAPVYDGAQQPDYDLECAHCGAMACEPSEEQP
jgi:hypothetical protein